MSVQVKICGITDAINLKAAVEAGADFVGFVFYPDSPRAISPEGAGALQKLLPESVVAVGLFVDPSDSDVANVLEVCPLGMIQLHGSETPERVGEIQSQFSLPVMKVIGVRDETDLGSVEAYEKVADWILFDTKVDGEHGGTGKSFDWGVLVNRPMNRPWMLAGGLDPLGVNQVLQILKPDAVDVSSGVEFTRGKKDPAKIRHFINAVKSVC